MGTTVGNNKNNNKAVIKSRMSRLLAMFILVVLVWPNIRTLGKMQTIMGPLEMPTTVVSSSPPPHNYNNDQISLFQNERNATIIALEFQSVREAASPRKNESSLSFENATTIRKTISPPNNNTGSLTNDTATLLSLSEAAAAAAPHPLTEPTAAPVLSPSSSSSSSLLVDKDDYIYSKAFLRKAWDTAPIISKEHKLIFFAVPKVGCTTWKQLFRRIKGIRNWRQDGKDIPHHPKKNGLTHLWDYSIEDASRIMADPNYTRAIFLREPKERFLSAFLDKALHQPDFIRTRCCKGKGPECVTDAQTTLDGFLNLTETCNDSHWTPQYDRMEAKYWPYINFFGSFETLAEDAERLLRQVGAWEKYGASGWGSEGNRSIFAKSTNPAIHATNARDKVSKWFTPELEERLEERYAKDYENLGSVLKNIKYTSNPTIINGTNITSSEAAPPSTNSAAPVSSSSFFVDENDYIYSKTFLSFAWDTAPIICEEHKLIFFAVPKVGCTTWKQLFRRIKGIPNWRQNGKDIPHHPLKNGLTHLWDYSLEDASRMMMDPNYTRAIFLREPKERFLSAFLDKALLQPIHIKGRCCKGQGPECVSNAQTLVGFMSMTETCKDSHWTPQYDRMEAKYWPYINFIGSFETLAEDAERLLRQVGAWDEYGASGWGSDGNRSIFAKSKNPAVHTTNAKDKVTKWFTPEIEEQLEERFAPDYENLGTVFKRIKYTSNPIINGTRASSEAANETKK